MTWDWLFSEYVTFLLVFARVSGMVMLNPFFSRRNVPTIVRAGLTFYLSLVMATTLDVQLAQPVALPAFVLICGKEFLVGYAVGVIMQMFTGSFLLAGDLVDYQLGVSMARIYDPQSNVSMPLTGSIFNLFWIVSFFAVNGHLTFVRIIYASFSILPVGPELINSGGYQYIVLLFSDILMLSLKIAMPIMAIELVTEVSFGIVMRVVPQINVFVAGMQLKLLIGLILIVLVLPSLFSILDSAMDGMMKSVLEGLRQLSGTG